MSNFEQIDFSTLIWVKKELDETLKRAQSALEEYVENPEDENQLQFCATYLHQVQGTLKMVELYGAAMVAEEMEQVAKKILNKEVDSEKDAFEVLMEGIILLPDYLERIQLGHKDIPMILLPLVNDLRTVKGDQLLSESALFNPNLSLGLPESKFSSSFDLSQSQLIQVINKIRSAYQICLLNWLKDIDVEANLKKLQIIVDKLKTVISSVDEKQLFWVAGGLFEALINGGIEKSVTIKQLAARLDQSIRFLISPDNNEEPPYKKLTNNLLYYVALADSKDRRIKEIQTFFNLSDLISDDQEIKHAQSSLSGKNRDLLESVTVQIKEDLMAIQESLDLYNRNDSASTSELEQIVDSLAKLSDTLGIIGIGIARSKLLDDISILKVHVNDDKPIDEDTIMHMAETLLFVESALNENIRMLGEIVEVDNTKEESLIPASEMKVIMDSLAKESIQNLQKVKQNFVLYIEAPWNKDSIQSSPKLLKEISGALKMSGFDKVAVELDRIEEYTTNYMLDTEYKPTVNQLDLLAESIASLEYYLEYISEGVKGESRILDLAKSNIELLFDSVAKLESQKKLNINEDLDQMTDDDFDMDLDDSIDNFDDKFQDDEDIYNNLLDESNTVDGSESNEDDATQVSVQKTGAIVDVSKAKELIVRFSDETDDDIKEVFTEEFEEELEHLASIFPIWKRNPEEQVELLGEIRRIYHTLKGSGRLVGALAIGDYSWRIEDMINLALNNSVEMNESFFMVMQSSTDILPKLFESLQQQSNVPEGYYEIIAAAEKVINGQKITAEDLVPKPPLQVVDTVDIPSEEIELDTYFENDDLDGSVDNNSEDEQEDELANEETENETLEELEIDNTDNETLEELEIDDTDSETEDETLEELEIDDTDNETEDETLEELEIDDTDNETKDETLEELYEPVDSSDVLDDLSVDPVFVEILQQEVEGHLNEIVQFIENSHSTNNTDSTEKFIRVIHTLNGAANMASVDSIVEMSTPLELSAKLTNELDKSFSDETITKISEFRQESSNIMKDLANNSESSTTSLGIASYFKTLIAQLESEGSGTSDIADDFDLTQFIDESEEFEDKSDIEGESVDEDITIDNLVFDSEEGEALEDETLDDEVLEEETLEDETLDDEVLEEETLEDETLDDKALEEALEDETLDDEVLEKEALEDETLEDETLDDEALEEETLEDETLDDEALEEETLEIHSESEHISAINYNQEENIDTANQINEFDEELLEIFKEEADDILDKTEHVLSELEENPKDASLILTLQRDLHTLKGGARMAGMENIGDLSHVLESLLEIIGEENRKVDTEILNIIHESFDLLNKMKEEDDYGQSVDISKTTNKVRHLIGLDDDTVLEESKLDLNLFDTIDAMDVADQRDVSDNNEDEQSGALQKQSNVLSGNQIKVNSELLDNLVNYAGEVSIYRSRLEQEIGSFRVNLSELGNTVARIREQLRKLDVETEAQIISTFQTEFEDDEGFDPLEMDRFSMLQQLSRSLTESVSDLTSIHSYLDDVARTSDNLLTQQSRVNTELQEGLMETRLVSFNSIVPRLRRLVRTTSQELGKSVKLDVSGAEGEMDKTVLEGIIAPLEHMLRNSLAHGIEENRGSVGKTELGSILIDVRREATEVIISITDDGAGIDRTKVKDLAISKGIINKDSNISNENIDRLILHSGFSTVDKVSKLAGRGVGMDVVSNQINLLGGTLDISSEPNKGTKFGIRLPYTLALSSALLVEISETVYAIPVSGLEGIIRMSYPDYLQKIKDQEFIYNYANEEYQLHELNTLLDIESEVIVENNQIPLVMIRSGENGVALRVDKILGSREIVIKTVGTQISSVPGILGATVLGDGNVVLILDIIPLSRSYMTKLGSLDDAAQVVEQIEIEKDPIIMIVDDSITMRKVGERILRRNNFDVVTAKDGLDALDNLAEIIPDVMLLDIEMPRMDGYELAVEMKKEQKYANIPIIMITSRTGEKHRQKAMDLGVDRYLGKPYQEADLLENIRDLLEEDTD